MMPGAGAARPRHGRIRGGYEAVRACAAPARPAAVDRRRAPEPKDGRVSKRRKTPQSPRAAAVGLQALLAAVFALIIVTVVGGLVWTTYRETAALSSEEATARFDALASTVAQRLRATFDPGLIMLDALAAMPLGRMEPLAAGRVILAIMQSDARRSPAVAAVQIGRDDGTALIVGRLDDDNREVAGAVYVFKVVTAGPDGLVQRTYHLDEQGRELAQTDTTPSDFDARNRPWYTASVVTPETITTPPYRYIGQRNIIGVTLARRATSEPGIVYGIDITLKRLSGTLTALKRSSGADLALFHPGGQLVAATEEAAEAAPDRPLIDGLPSITEAGNPLLSALFRAYAAGGAVRDKILSIDEEDYFVRFDRPGAETGLVTAISMPESVVLGPAASLRDRQLAIGLAAMVAAALVSLLAARQLTRPLGAVTRAISGISRFEFEASRARPSHIREIDELWTMVLMLERTLRTFTCYVPAHLVRSIARDRKVPMVGGIRQEVTVLFTDVEGFTSMSERADPHALMTQMSRYFGTIAAGVTASGGFVDKYIGDSVMAVWVSSPACQDHAARACAATLDIVARLEALNAAFRREGLPGIRTRYGLNTGAGIVGHVGSIDRLSYTVIGHTVNVASRLEQHNKQLGTTILVSEDVVKAAGAGFAFAPAGLAAIKGLSSGIRVYELRSAASADQTDTQL